MQFVFSTVVWDERDRDRENGLQVRDKRSRKMGLKRQREVRDKGSRNDYMIVHNHTAPFLCRVHMGMGDEQHKH